MLFLLILIILIIFIFFKYYQLLLKNQRNKNILKNKQKLINTLINIKNNTISKKKRQIKDPIEINQLKLLTNEFNNDPKKWINIIKIGEIYTKGSYPILLPNKYLGLECFKLAMKSSNKNIVSLAYLKYNENKYNNINIIDQQGKNIPTEYANKIFFIANNNYNNNENNDNYLVDIDLNNNNENNENNDNYLVDIDLNDNNQNNDNNNINDLQNIHDHSVNNIIKSNINLYKTITYYEKFIESKELEMDFYDWLRENTNYIDLCICYTIYEEVLKLSNKYKIDIIQDNVKILKSRGFEIMNPDNGRLTGEDSGIGRFPETSEIISTFLTHIGSHQDQNRRLILQSASQEETRGTL